MKRTVCHGLSARASGQKTRMRSKFFTKRVACSAALHCVCMLSAALLSFLVAAEGNGSGVRPSSLFSVGNDVGVLDQLGEKKTGGLDAASVLVEAGDVGQLQKVEGEGGGRSFRRRKGGRPSVSKPRGRLSGRSSSSKSTRTARKIFIVPALISLAVLLSWRLGNVLVKCLTRARALKPTAGSRPRALSDTHIPIADFDPLCAIVDLDDAEDGFETIPLMKISSRGAADGFETTPLMNLFSRDPADDDEEEELVLFDKSESTDWGGGLDGGLGGVPGYAAVAQRKAGRDMKLRLLKFAVIAVIVVVLMFSGKEQGGPARNSTAVPSRDNQTSAPLRLLQTTPVVHEPNTSALEAAPGAPGRETPVSTPSTAPTTTSLPPSHPLVGPSSNGSMAPQSESNFTGAAASSAIPPAASPPSTPSIGATFSPLPTPRPSS
ncbi:hypothetical protein CSUI_010021 [Cystoisospora suis]|uniref:Transmembrane protein n=1 Tax=Cystoisospora suis TaxID=483139 RepID=A0A2C6KIE2_9APIC|nr:hypothetical protein CSUI_010021 [Cystoisospora suis]